VSDNVEKRFETDIHTYIAKLVEESVMTESMSKSLSFSSNFLYNYFKHKVTTPLAYGLTTLAETTKASNLFRAKKSFSCPNIE
jgi:hypothetical protein